MEQLGIETHENTDIQMFFNLQTNDILYKIYTGNKYIERLYFNGKFQDKFIIENQDMYTAAAYYDLGQQLSSFYENIFIKQDQDDREIYLSVIE